MTPYKAPKLPISYSLDKELLTLISEANSKYSEYRTMSFDSKYFLDSVILSESLKSTQIEGTQISQDEIYYLKYMPRTDDNLEIQNLKKIINYGKKLIEKKEKIDLKFVNDTLR